MIDDLFSFLDAEPMEDDLFQFISQVEALLESPEISWRNIRGCTWLVRVRKDGSNRI
jgi:hypothetical protein